MPTPKSVVKFSKDGIEYTSSVDKANYYLFELTRRALMDIGRLISRTFNKKYAEHFKPRSKYYKKATRYAVFSNKDTKYPRITIGLRGSLGFYSYFQEFGSSKTKKLGLLTSSVVDNVDTIREIESQYLSAINVSESEIESHINEKEMEGDADE